MKVIIIKEKQSKWAFAAFAAVLLLVGSKVTDLEARIAKLERDTKALAEER